MTNPESATSSWEELPSSGLELTREELDVAQSSPELREFLAETDEQERYLKENDLIHSEEVD